MSKTLITQHPPLISFLRFRLGLTQTGDPVSVFPLAAFLEQFRTLKTLEHIPFAAQSGSRAQTTML